MWQRLDALAVETCGEKVPVVAGWGTTETAVATAVHFAMKHSGSIGLPVPGCEIKMLPTPREGRLELRIWGPNVTPGYWRRDDLTREAFDEDGFLRVGDTGRLVDPDVPECGLEFVGRMVEDFKLTSGVWVHPAVVRVRAITAGAPVIQDAVITGHDRAEIGLLIVPNEQGCRALCSDLPTTTPLERLLDDPRVRQRVSNALDVMNEADGTPVRRALLMKEPLSSDSNEITDKGYVNQRAVLERRFQLVERLYAVIPDSEIITAGSWH